MRTHTKTIVILLAAALLLACAGGPFCQRTSTLEEPVEPSLESGPEIAIDEPGAQAQEREAGESAEEAEAEAVIEVISGDLVRIGSGISVSEDEEVRGSVVSVWGSVDVDGKVTQDVVAIGGPVTLGPTAEVMGDCVAVGGAIDKAPGAKVHGDTVTVGIPVSGRPWSKGVPWLFGMGPLGPFGQDRAGGIALAAAAEFVINLVLGLAVGVLILLLFPRRVSIVTATINQQAAKSLGAGILAAVVGVVVFVVSLLLILLLVGIPLLLIEVSLFVAALLLGEVAVALLLGTRISSALNWQVSSQFGPLVIGIFIFALLISVPYVGGLIHLVLFFVATGAVVLSGYGARTDWLSRRTQAQSIPTSPVGGGGKNQ